MHLLKLFPSTQGQKRDTGWESRSIHQAADTGSEPTLKAITHQQHTERKLCYLITDPICHQDLDFKMCFDYLLTTCLNLQQCHWAAASFWDEFRLSQSSTGTLHPCIYCWQGGTSQARSCSRWTWCHWSQHAGDQLFWSQPLSPAVQGVFGAPNHLLKKPIVQQFVFEHVRGQSAEILSKEQIMFTSLSSSTELISV